MSEYTAAVWPLGLFALMAVMIAVIAGSTGIRMLFIDGEYRKIIDSMQENSATGASQDSEEPADDSCDKSRARRTNRWMMRRSHTEDLLDMRGRRASNRGNVNKDGLYIGGILIVGFATALGLIQSLYVSAALVAIFFSSAMIPFYSHAQTVLKSSD
ncbi:MAG: hypothetical protein J4F28_08825 [Nitrosopumilaceae archaeon]|nr:hypothetical protein [Nitrosopumilaceae archaeon]